MTKREWQIEMANRFAKRDNVKELEAKLECYERLVDSINMASNPVSEKSRVALREVREMKTIMTKEEEILRAVEAEREACAVICETYWNRPNNGMLTEEEVYGSVTAKLIRARSKHD